MRKFMMDNETRRAAMMHSIVAKDPMGLLTTLAKETEIECVAIRAEMVELHVASKDFVLEYQSLQAQLSSANDLLKLLNGLILPTKEL